MPRYGKPYFAKTYKAWRDTAHRLVPEHSGEPIEEPARVDVLFAIPRARTSKLVVPHGDGDNFEKALYDLLVRKKYLLDDKWITTGLWKKRFLDWEEDGYTEVTISEETDDIDL